MYGNSFFAQAGLPLSTAKGALDATFGHGTQGLFGACAASAKGREEQAGMAVSAPVLAQQLKRRVRQQNIAVLGALAAVDMDHHARAIDIGDFEMESLVQAQAAGVDGGEVGVVVEGFDVG